MSAQAGLPRRAILPSSRVGCSSRVAPLVAVVETADPRKGDDLGCRRRLRSHRPAVRHISTEAHVPTVGVVVIDKGTDQLDGVSLTEDDSMIEHLPSACADPAFGHRILPWAAVGRSTGLDPTDLMNRMTSLLKIESRSKTRYLGAVSNGKASRSCWMTHCAVGL